MLGRACLIMAFFCLPALARGLPPDAQHAWEAFRKEHPFQFQSVAYGKRQNGAEIIIISEPPPHFPHSDPVKVLQAIFGASLIDAAIVRHEIAMESWVEDVVAVLKPSPDRRLQLDLLEASLFGTVYGSVELPLPVQPSHVQGLAPSDEHVSALELQKWLVSDHVALIRLGGGPLETFAHVISDEVRPGVWTSPDAGLVLLILPTDQPIEPWRGDIRRFAVSTDAILGAIEPGANAKRLAIIGRARTTSQTAMPPLRAETVLLLAGTKESHLKQSFGWRRVLCGNGLTGLSPAW